MSFYCWAFSFFFSSFLGKSEIVPFFAAAVQRGQKGSLKKYVCATCMAEKKKSQSMVVEHSLQRFSICERPKVATFQVLSPFCDDLGLLLCHLSFGLT